MKEVYFLPALQGVTELTHSLQTHAVWANAERSEAQKNIKFDATLWGAQPSSQ